MTTQKYFDSLILPTIYQAVGGGALTVPPSVGADTFAMLAAAQTLTSKLGYNGLVVTPNTGVITTGTWSGTGIVVGKGGTGVATLALNGVLFGNDANAVGVTAIGAEGQLLRAGASPFVPAWTTATFPATTTINQLLYSSAANVVGGLATGNSMVLVTGAGGIPAFSSTLPAVTLGGNMTVTGRAFVAGAGSTLINTTGSYQGLALYGSHATHGVLIRLDHTHTTPDVGNIIGGTDWYGFDGAGTPVTRRWAYFRALYANVTDGTEAVEFNWAGMAGGAFDNIAMTLSGAGVLAVDLAGSGTPAQVDLFDEYDDALMLRQGIQQNNRELLADMGVFERKDTGSGYMMKIQPMVRLLAGGIYQSRTLIDALTERLEIAERKLLALPQAEASE